MSVLEGFHCIHYAECYVPGSGLVDGDVSEREKVCPHNLEQLKLLLTRLTQFPLQLWEGEEGGGGGMSREKMVACESASVMGL